MPAIREPSKDLKKFMRPYPAHVQEQALMLRKMILNEAPNSFELIYDSYNALTTAFSLSEKLKHAFCHVPLYSKHVNLGFNQGTALADPDELLIGSGRHIRHLKIQKEEDIQSKHAQEFIKKAIDHIHQKYPNLEQSSQAKAMVKSVAEHKRRPN